MAERSLLLVGAAGPAGQALRQRLWDHHEALAGSGLGFPLERPSDQNQAVTELVDGAQDDAQGDARWPALVRAVEAEKGTAVVVNAARLAKLGRERAAEVVASLEPVEVVVMLPIASWAAQQRWQARLLVGDTAPWEAWVSRASSFLTSWDPLPALESWSAVAPVHLVVGRSVDELAEGLMPVLRASYALTAPARLTGAELAGSLGPAGVELLRRFNAGPGTAYDESDYRRYVQPFLVARGLVDGSISRPAVPGAEEYADRLAQALRGPLAGRVAVHGDLTALAEAGATTPTQDEQHLLDAGLAAWVRQLESVEGRLQRGLETRRARAQAQAGSDG